MSQVLVDSKMKDKEQKAAVGTDSRKSRVLLKDTGNSFHSCKIRGRRTACRKNTSLGAFPN